MASDQSYACPDENCEDKCKELKDKMPTWSSLSAHGTAHSDRNYCNKCPKKPPEITNTTTMVASFVWEGWVPFRKEVPVYRD